MTEMEPVVFPNKEGLKLFGILHRPESEIDRKICILLLSPGVKMRVGPHRLYNKMTEDLVKLGFTVFRFDFAGLGDSEGEIDEPLLADFYSTVQVGRYVDDTNAAMNWVQDTLNIERFILSGLCGGAITGLLTGARDSRVEALVGLGIPVILDSSQVDHTRYITEGQVKRLKQGYIRRLLEPKSWIRLLTFRSNYLAIFKVLRQMLFGKAKVKKPGVVETPEKPTQGGNINPHFAPAFFQWMENSRKIFLVFSGTDRLTWEFDEKFSSVYADKLKAYTHLYQVYTVPDANHIFTFADWYGEMMEQVTAWIKTNYQESI